MSYKEYKDSFGTYYQLNSIKDGADWMNSNGESFASVSTPETSEVCIVFRTFNLQINPNLIKSFGTKT